METKKDRIDIMCDIETMGTASDATVFQIAAGAFNIETGEILKYFNESLDIKNVKKLGVDGSTLLWWLDTDKELFAQLLKCGTIPSEEKLFDDFRKWIEELKEEYENVFFWGNGILFDNRIISEKMKFYGMTYPIYYRNDRDMRTIVELAAVKCGVTVNDFLNEHKLAIRAHDAYNDVCSQIKICCDAWNFLILK